MSHILGCIGEDGAGKNRAGTLARQGMQVVQTCGMFLPVFFCYKLAALRACCPGKAQSAVRKWKKTGLL